MKHFSRLHSTNHWCLISFNEGWLTRHLLHIDCSHCSSGLLLVIMWHTVKCAVHGKMREGAENIKRYIQIHGIRTHVVEVQGEISTWHYYASFILIFTLDPDDFIFPNFSFIFWHCLCETVIYVLRQTIAIHYQTRLVTHWSRELNLTGSHIPTHTDTTWLTFWLSVISIPTQVTLRDVYLTLPMEHSSTTEM